MRYYISDPHFFHGGLNIKMDMRGFSSVEEMNAYMLEKWNGRVRQNDEVIILGDLSWGNAEQTNELLQKLNGKLYLIEGNHDRFLTNRKFDASRFVWIKPYAELHDRGRKVILCHYPIMCYNGQYHLDREGNPKTWMLYGHVHNSYDELLIDRFIEITRQSRREIHGLEGLLNIPCNMINCFCMFSDYTPLSLDEWIEVDAKRRERLKTENYELPDAGYNMLYDAED